MGRHMCQIFDVNHVRFKHKTMHGVFDGCVCLSICDRRLVNVDGGGR